MGFRTDKVTIEFTTPLLQHNPRGVDPDFHLQRDIRKITAKKANKTEEDRQRLKKLEFHSHGYFDDNCGPYLTATHFEAALKEAGKLSRDGKNIERGLEVRGIDDPQHIFLEYNGPRKAQELFEFCKDAKGNLNLDNNPFIDIRVAGNKKSRILRTRPRFPTKTKATFLLDYQTDILDPEKVVSLVERAGLYIGVGDGRAIKMGRFLVVSHEEYQQ